MITAVVRRPGPRLDQGLVTHQRRVPVDVDLAMVQWAAYVDALAAQGWQIYDVRTEPECPDATFVEDTSVIFDDLALMTRPGAPSRRPEVDEVRTVMWGLGLELRNIEPPGTLDGGDVLKVGRTVYVGVGGRTNRVALAQLTMLLSPRGWIVKPVRMGPALHLKSVVTALPDGRILGHRATLGEDPVFPNVLSVPEPCGAHVVVLDDRRLLISAGAQRTAELLCSHGFEPVPVDISEFEKLEGCVTCLSVRIRNFEVSHPGVPERVVVVDGEATAPLGTTL